jgi:hypothetical protein
MKGEKKIIEGDIEEPEVDEAIKKLITSKIDRDKRRRWSKLLKEKHGIEAPEDYKKKESE